MSGSDSDEAPDDIGFTTSKEQALETLRGAADLIRQEKLKTKEKRRKRQEKFAEQKQEKLDRLKAKQIDPSILDELPDELPSKSDNAVPVEEASEVQSKKIKFDEDDDNDEYLALSTGTKFKVVSQRDQTRMKTASDEALNFRERHLFGSHVRREAHKSVILRRKNQVTKSALCVKGKRR